MGHPKKLRKKYWPPSHPWQKARLEEERLIKEKYAPKNKTQIYKMTSMLKDFKYQAKKLSSSMTKQSEKEKELLLAKLRNIGLIKEGDNLDSILILTLENIMERRLQTMVCRKGLARSMKQARQFITHCHIKVADHVITSPAYIVLKKEEDLIRFSENSAIANPDHPERQIAKPVETKKEEISEKKKAEERPSREKKAEKRKPLRKSKRP